MRCAHTQAKIIWFASTCVWPIHINHIYLYTWTECACCTSTKSCHFQQWRKKTPNINNEYSTGNCQHNSIRLEALRFPMVSPSNISIYIQYTYVACETYSLAAMPKAMAKLKPHNNNCNIKNCISLFADISIWLYALAPLAKSRLFATVYDMLWNELFTNAHIKLSIKAYTCERVRI